MVKKYIILIISIFLYAGSSFAQNIADDYFEEDDGYTAAHQEISANHTAEDASGGYQFKNDTLLTDKENQLVQAVFNGVLNPQFLYYWLTTPEKVNHYCSIADCSQSAYPSFTKEVIETLDFPSISITTQHSITNTIPYSIFNLPKFSKICLSNSAPSAVKALYSCSNFNAFNAS